MLTVEDIYGYAQDLLSFEGEDIGVPGLEEPRTIQWVNDLNKQFFEEFYSRRLTVPDYLASYTGFTRVAATALAADVSAGATSFTIDDSAALDTSGAGLLYRQDQYDIFEHSGNSAGTVSGIPASGRGSLRFGHDEDEYVGKLYKLPPDFGRMRPVKRHANPLKNHDGVTVSGRGFGRVPYQPSGCTFSVYEGTSNSFLWLPKDTGGDIQVHYDIKPTELTEADDEINVREPHHWYLVHGLVALFKQVEDEDYVPAKEQADMAKVISQALVKDTVARPIVGNKAFFGRMR